MEFSRKGGYTIEDNFSRPFYQKGFSHFLLYRLDGTIKGKKSGFYIPPVIYFDNLELFIRRKNELFELSRYVRKVSVELTHTIHYYHIPELQLNLEITFLVVQESPSLVIDIRTDKRQYELLMKMSFPFEYVWRGNLHPARDISVQGKELVANSLFDKNLKTLVQFNRPFEYKARKVRMKLDNIQMRIYGSSFTDSVTKAMMKMSKQAIGRYISAKKKRYVPYLFDKSNLRSEDKNLDTNFSLAKYDLILLRHYQPGLGEGFFAGIPYFPEYFGRDTLWSVPGILMTGDFENVKYTLNLLSRYQSEHRTESKHIGQIPHEIWLTGEPNYYSADSTMLYIYAMYQYYIWTRDLDFIKRFFPRLESAFSSVKANMSRGMIGSRRHGFLRGNTWMDSYNRSNYPIEMQVLLAVASSCLSYLSRRVKKADTAREALEVYKGVSKRLSSFWTGNKYADRIKRDGSLDLAFTCNQLTMLMFGLSSNKEADMVFEQMKSLEMISRAGIRSRAKKTIGYDPNHYHKGMIWPLATAWGIMGALKYRRWDLADELLKTYNCMWRDYIPGFIPECVQGNRYTLNFSGDKFSSDKQHFTSYLQLWSAAMYIQAVVQGIFGVQPLPHSKKVRIAPAPVMKEYSISNLRIFDSSIDIKVSKDKVDIRLREGSLKVMKDTCLLDEFYSKDKR